MAKQDYYTTLGVQRNADAKDIKQAYRRLARKYHPDVNPGDAAAEQKFKEVSEAYSVLENPDTRRKYDQFGHQAFGSGGFDPFAGRGQGGFSAENLRDLFGNQGSGGGFSEGFGSIFEDIFGGGQSRSRRSSDQPSRDLEQTVTISFENAVKGTSIKVSIPRSNGGTDRLQVKIPAGVDTGSKIRVPGKGRTGRYGGSPGDLYIITQVQPHRYFTREGNDILCELPITLGEAMLGAKIDVPTIDGTISMTVPAGTQNGRTFRLRGKGAPALKGGEPGDQYVKITIALPTNLDERSRELITEFDYRNSLEPRAHMR